ncbi:PREDICTED: solute carrier family 22 member 18 [Elephantulus edwardii]|uniref:solute carrier family 22 member 18 n=1 Tax=Elephantulus edwardii TaxID=28737 RepID=UPI0003F09E66|nr:PREDICTED: solute carrier family 22 member 18 [Elephantulus edwardii]
MADVPDCPSERAPAPGIRAETEPGPHQVPPRAGRALHSAVDTPQYRSKKGPWAHTCALFQTPSHCPACGQFSCRGPLAPARMLGAGASPGQGQPPSTKAALSRRDVLLLTYVLASLELTCLFMQFSVMPYLTRSLGLDSIAFGYLQTTFGVLQLLGGPMFGRFADQRGARAAFTLSFLASSALYLLLAAACSPALPGILLLFTSRIPSALMHIMPVAPNPDPASPDAAPASGQAPALLMQCPILVALAINVLGTVLSFTFIPASTKGTSGDAQAPPAGNPKASVFDLKAISRLLLLPGVLPVFLIKVVSGFPSGLFMIMFSIISMDFFKLEAAQAGYLNSYIGILQMVVQGLVVGRLSRRFSKRTLLQASVLVFVIVGLAMALMANVYHFCLLAPGLIFSLCVLNVVTDSMLTQSVSPADTGTMLGLCATVQPLTRTLGPTLSGLLYHHVGVPVFGHVQAAVNLLVFLMLWKMPLLQKTDKLGTCLAEQAAWGPVNLQCPATCPSP